MLTSKTTTCWLLTLAASWGKWASGCKVHFIKHTITATRAQLMFRNQRCKGSIFSFYELLSIRVPGPYTTWHPWLDYFRFYYEIKWILVRFQARYIKSFLVKPQFSRRGLSLSRVRMDRKEKRKRGNKMKRTSTTCRTNGSYLIETWTHNSGFYGTFTWGTQSITDSFETEQDVNDLISRKTSFRGLVIREVFYTTVQEKDKMTEEEKTPWPTGSLLTNLFFTTS